MGGVKPRWGTAGVADCAGACAGVEVRMEMGWELLAVGSRLRIWVSCGEVRRQVSCRNSSSCAVVSGMNRWPGGRNGRFGWCGWHGFGRRVG